MGKCGCILFDGFCIVLLGSVDYGYCFVCGIDNFIDLWLYFIWVSGGY